MNSLLRPLLLGAALVVPTAASATHWNTTATYVSMDGGVIGQQLYFDLQGFTPAEEETVKAGIKLMITEVHHYFAQERIDQVTPIVATCAVATTTKDKDPVNSSSSRTVRQRIGNAMTGMIQLYGTSSASQRSVISAISVPSSDGSSIVMARARLNTDWLNTSMSIMINRVALGTGWFNERDWAGAVFHEFMHRLGWNHPTGYPGSLIFELGRCVTRGRSGSHGTDNHHRFRDIVD